MPNNNDDDPALSAPKMKLTLRSFTMLFGSAKLEAQLLLV